MARHLKARPHNRISLSWPQLARHECALIVHLTPTEAELVSTLLLHSPDTFVPTDTLIEAIYPNPDEECEFPLQCITVVINRLRDKGLVIENSTSSRYFGTQVGGYRIPLEGRL